MILFSEIKFINHIIAMQIIRRQILYQRPSFHKSLAVSKLIRNIYLILVFYFDYESLLFKHYQVS